jgi:ferric-dicitrate binding protein FerR (iron transport regulator)
MSEGEYNIDELIADWFSNEIDEDKRQFLLQWIDRTDENKSYFQRMQNIWQVAHPAFAPESIDVENAESRVRKRIEKRVQVSPWILVWWQRIAAVMIIPLLFALVWLFLWKAPGKPQAIVYQEISSPLGMRSEVNLPDGSSVWLNSGSKLRYPVPFNGKERRLYLSGEAFFKVHSDSLHPFFVDTKHLEVRATGTRFNVEAYPEDSLTAVTLEKGKVGVNIARKIKVQLRPNQRVLFNSRAGTYNVSTTDAQEWDLWRNGILSFRDEPLGEVFKRVGRTFNVDIHIKDQSVAGQLYRATFENESLDEILHLLKLSAPIQYKITDRQRLNNGTYSREKIEVLDRRH